MEKGLQSAESILNRLRRYRFEDKTILTIRVILERVEKNNFETNAEQHLALQECIHALTNATIDSLDASVVCGIIGIVVWITHLQLQNKILNFNENQFDQVVKWLKDNLKVHCGNFDVISSICIALDGLFSTHPVYSKHNFASICPDIINYLSWESTIDVIINAIRCLESILKAINEEQLNEALELSSSIGEKLLLLYYCDKIPAMNGNDVSVFLIHSLHLTNRVASTNSEFCRNNISELLGMAKSLFHFGVGNSDITMFCPQKVYISQQVFYDSRDDINLEKSRVTGGKTLKTRKLRLSSQAGEMNTDMKKILLSFDIKTSDSEISDSENGSVQVLYERNKMAKIRMASIALVGILVKNIERKIIYGYWHVLFASGDSPDKLLYIGQHDPNMRCRCAALQVCAQVLYGSKEFLHQAETDEKRCPTTFIPFSVSLGHTIITIYKELITILSTESSTAVLTQALKCLAVLVQATPFQKLQKGFLSHFVRHIRPFIYHRDVAIQVSALMVMEFLLCSAESSTDIAGVVGAPQLIPLRLPSKLNPLGDEELDIVENDEYLESDSSEIGHNVFSEHIENTSKEKGNEIDRPWLLHRVLDNLRLSNKTTATSVRIASMQVLIAFSSHFAMLTRDILEVGVVLSHNIDNTLPDVRIHAARCIDMCAYQISRFVMESAALSPEERKKFSQFWTDILPLIYNHISRDKEEVAAVRITLCDALSNIGVDIFENSSHSTQMGFLSFLSGVSSDCADDIMVRAAAVRALAVYVLYPTLRGDFVFLENTADLTLRLVNDPNLLVRVKSYWSMANISDALLLGKCTDSKKNHERISDELLQQMINVSIVGCSDNDKVRCNAVRALGNLLRLITADFFHSEHAKEAWKKLFEKSVGKLTDCLRSSGNAKVKWNTCYAISNILKNSTIFEFSDLNWQITVYAALCHVIVNHPNFKVRINATAAILSIAKRQHFGNHFELFWCSILEAIEQSYNLDSFQEYNHRDNLQDQLCLALAHILTNGARGDWIMFMRRLSPRVEIIQNTWKRVVLRMVPEKAAPLLACPLVILEKSKSESVANEEEKAVDYLVKIFRTSE